MSLRERIKSLNIETPDIVITPHTSPIIVYDFGETTYCEDDNGELFELKPKVTEAIKSVFKTITSKDELTGEMIGLLAYLECNTSDAIKSWDIDSINLTMEGFLNAAEYDLEIELDSLVNGAAIGILQDEYLLEIEAAGFSINQNAIERT